MPRTAHVVDVTSFNSDAKFRAWGLATSTALQATGLVQTADTGQINWATVARPTTVTTKAGYEIYRFADALQATVPVYFKLEYGTSAVTGGAGPATWLTVGTGSNGSGTITGLNTGVLAAGSTGTSTAPSVATAPSFFTHTDGYALFALNLGMQASSLSCGLWAIDRTRDTDGSPTSEGVSVFFHNNSATAQLRMVCLSFTAATLYGGRSVAAAVPISASTIANPTIAFGKAYGIMSNGAVPHLATLSYHNAEMATQYNTFTATPFGSTPHEYLAMGSVATGANTHSDTGYYAAMLWDA